MNIRYTPSQADTRAGLSYCWSEFPTFRLLVILVGALGGLVGLALSFSLVNALTLPVIFFTAAGTLILPWLLRRQLIAATKTDVRVLLIDRDGISTEIGQWSGLVPWRQVLRVDATAHHVFIVGRTFSFFAIPLTAFQDDADRETFIGRMKKYHATATERLR